MKVSPRSRVRKKSSNLPIVRGSATSKSKKKSNHSISVPVEKEVKIHDINESLLLGNFAQVEDEFEREEWILFKPARARVLSEKEIQRNTQDFSNTDSEIIGPEEEVARPGEENSHILAEAGQEQDFSLVTETDLVLDTVVDDVCPTNPCTLYAVCNV